MSAKTKVRKRLPRATDEEVIDWIVRNDLRLYCEKFTSAKARKEFREQMQKSVSVSSFRDLVNEHCKWFTHFYRKPLRAGNMLTSKQWDKVKAAAQQVLLQMQGIPLDWCVEIMRAHVSVSRTVLQGLPSRFHVWSDK